MRTAKLSRSILSILLIGLAAALLACQSTGGTHVANDPPDSNESVETANAVSDANLGTAVDINSESLRSTMSKIRTVGTAFLAWYVDNLESNPSHRAPMATDISSNTPVDQALPLLSEKQLRSMLVPKYIPSLDLADGWGNPIEVRATGVVLSGQEVPGSELSLALISAGADGVFQSGPFAMGCYHPEQQPQTDIAWTDGYFFTYPARGLDQDCSTATTRATLR